MAYQVLARKYRPQKFTDVIGQDHVTQTLLNALSQDRIAHGYIFSGHRGIGKTTIARILAMALECRTPQGTAKRPIPEPCGICDACVEIRAGNAMDVIEIDAATNRGIDEIRELREGARYSPARDRYKIYILDEAHQITDAAFNALLKTLEEPPAHVIFMMATTQPEDIPQTIRSRCQHFSFHAVRFQEIVEQLRSIAQKESVEVDEAALSLLAEAGDGSMRDALSIMDQAIASAPLIDGSHTLDASQIRSLMGTVSNQIFEQMMDAVKEQNAASMLGQAAQLLDAGNSPQQIARQMVRFLRNCLMARLAGEKSDLLQVSDEERARAGRIATIFSEEDLTRFLNSMLRTFDDLSYRQEQRFHLELGLLKLVHMQRLLPFEELFRQLSGGANSTPATPGAPRLQPSVPTPVLSRPGAPQAAAQEQTSNSPEPKAHPLEGVFTRASATVATGGNASPLPRTAAKASMPSDVPAAPAQQASGIREASAIALPLVEANTAAVNAIANDGSSSSESMPPEDSAPAGQLNPAIDAESLRTALCGAMIAGGHETAGSLFEAGSWEWDGSELRVRVGASKTLLDLVYTPHAQQIVREHFRRVSGSMRTVKMEPGEISGSARPQAKRPAAETPVPNGRPEDHPLIRRAQELFHAEVRSVVSLRDSR